MDKSKTLYYAGALLQSYWCYIVLRDLLITVANFVKGQRHAFPGVIALHYVLACLDHLLLSGLMIWGTIALN